jgi:sulfur transfer protein SufE
MESDKHDSEETVADLCKRADAEQDFEKLLELASKLQKLIEARRSEKKP